MVKFVFLIPIVLAGRNKRSAEINSIETAASQLLDLPSLVVTNGCHCPALGSAESRVEYPAYFGSPKDKRDVVCKRWMATRDCLFLSGGSCENENSPSYTYDSSTGCNQINSCDKALCEVDTAFAAEINTMNTDPYWKIVDNNAAGECVRANNRPEYDSCCGSTYATFTKYVSSEATCVNDVVTTIRSCSAGQQLNSNNECENCPADMR